MQAVVSVKAIAVYGDCPEYPAGQISMKTFVKWAAATRTDLQSYPALNDKMRVLEQCITPEAKTALWACTTLTTNGVPVDYPSDAVKNAANAANLKARSDFHIEWLTEIIAACSPNTSAHIVKEMEKVRFGEGASGGITGRCYQEDDVIRYMGKMLDLQKQRGDPMRTGRADEQGEARHREASSTDHWSEESSGVDSPGGDCAGRRQVGRRATKAREGTQEVRRSCSAAAVDYAEGETD